MGSGSCRGLFCDIEPDACLESNTKKPNEWHGFLLLNSIPPKKVPWLRESNGLVLENRITIKHGQPEGT